MGILVTSDPQTLLRTIFWLIRVNFGLRGGQEHRNLKLSNFTFKQDSDGRDYILYTECISKAYTGGLKHMHVQPHSTRAYAIPIDQTQCIFTIMRKYISLCEETSLSESFYLRPLLKPTEKMWYGKQPLGHNTLSKMVSSIMTAASFQGNFTNHSLRATAASRLFQASVDEQLIMGVTGHRSTAVRTYKRPNDDQLRDLSNIISGSAGKSMKVDKIQPTAECAIASESTDRPPRNVTLNVYGGQVFFV